MGTSFLQELPDPEQKPKSEVKPFLANHAHVPNTASVHSGCLEQRPIPSQSQYLEEDDAYPFGRPRRRLPPGHSPNNGGYGNDDECRVRFGLHYSSCFSKYKDFDDKFGELQHHVQSLPRGRRGNTSPCSTLQLLAKVKSSPIFDRCYGNQYLLRTPYQMYNVKGELRYIVQDPPHLEQCYLEATCSIPSDVCSNYGYPAGRRGYSSCESRHCHHTLLAWDPSSPDSGTFFDIFEYACCCNCHHNNPPPSRSQIG